MTIVHSWDNGVQVVTHLARVVNNATNNYAYTMSLYGWRYSSNWLHTVNCNPDNTHIAVLSMIVSVRDQIAFDTTQAKLEGAIFNFVFDGNYPKWSNIFFMKDEVTANRYYFVTWDNDDNSTHAWRKQHRWYLECKQQCSPNRFTNGTHNGCNGKARGERAGDDFDFQADIGPAERQWCLKCPSNLTKVQVYR